MAIKGARIADYQADGFAAATGDVELLCRDFRSTYVIPFPCRRSDDAWINGQTGEILQAEVVGWRPWAERPRNAPAREPSAKARLDDERV